MSWDRFEIKGEGCTQDYPVTLTVTTTWDDDRFLEEFEWLQYNKTDLDNSKTMNFVKVESKAIYDLQIEATIIVKARIEGKSNTSSFKVVVIILPAQRQIKVDKSIKAHPPAFKISSISVSGLLVMQF